MGQGWSLSAPLFNLYSEEAINEIEEETKNIGVKKKGNTIKMLLFNSTLHIAKSETIIIIMWFLQYCHTLSFSLQTDQTGTERYCSSSSYGYCILSMITISSFEIINEYWIINLRKSFFNTLKLYNTDIYITYSYKTFPKQ